MRKAKWKRVVAAGAILMSLGMVFPAADIQAEEVDFGPGIVEIVENEAALLELYDKWEELSE